MERKIRRQTKVKAFEPTLDVDEFNALTDLLFELMKENHSACAKLLGVSRLTWKKWEKTPPDWPWWNLVLRHLIKRYITALRGRRGLTGRHRQKVMDRLAAIPSSTDFEEEIDAEAYRVSGAAEHIRRLLTPGGMWLSDIIKPANSGGYTEKALRRGAKMIGVVKTQEGYGKNKDSFWRLADQDDD